VTVRNVTTRERVSLMEEIAIRRPHVYTLNPMKTVYHTGAIAGYVACALGLILIICLLLYYVRRRWPREHYGEPRNEIEAIPLEAMPRSLDIRHEDLPESAM